MTKLNLLSGSYTGPGGEGLKLLSFDTDTGTFEQVIGFPGTPDVSWIIFNPNTRTVYVTDEMSGQVGAFTLATNSLHVSPLGYQSTGAKFPCYLRLSPGGTQLAAANYGDDSVPVYTLGASGALGANPVVLRGTQDHAAGHAHWTQWSPEGDRLYVVDLGHDEVRSFPYDAGTGGFDDPEVAFSMPKGSGPRHLAFHPGGKFAYLWTEYANVLTALSRNADGTLTQINALSALPPEFTDTSFGAHIQVHPKGDTVYVSNRGHNSIAVFAIAADGSISLKQIVSCGGDWPRFFILLGNHLVVANQKSEDLVTFAVAADGTLEATGKVFKLQAPVALLPI